MIISPPKFVKTIKAVKVVKDHILIRLRRQILMAQRPTLLWAIRTNMTAGAAVVVPCSLLSSALTSALTSALACSVLIFGGSFAHYSGRCTLLAAVLCSAML